MTTHGAPWTNEAWRAKALAWIAREVASHGWVVTEPIEQPHVRWWSTVFRITTSDGVLWMKASQPAYAFETRLTPFLAERWPDVTVGVVATDPDRGWMLTRDAGTRLREAIDRSPIEHWAGLLPRYAELQIAVSTERSAMDAMSVPNRTLTALAADLRAAVDEPEMVLTGDPRGLTPEQLDDVRARLAVFDADCRRLAALGIPETLQHDDLHDGNAFVRDGAYVVFDWGDACISHPFHTMAVTFRALAYARKLEPGGADIRRLTDAYLEPWEAIVPRAQVREAADIARRTGTIGRAMAYRGWVKRMPRAEADEEVASVPYGLRLFLADAPWGTWDDGTF